MKPQQNSSMNTGLNSQYESQLGLMNNQQMSYHKGDEAGYPQMGFQNTGQNAQVYPVMMAPAMPVSKNANPLFPWTENIVYVGNRMPVIYPGTPIPDPLPDVQVPYLKERPINFQEYKEYLAEKQEIELPEFSIKWHIKVALLRGGYMALQGAKMNQQLKTYNMFLPATGKKSPVTFWCPVCQQIQKTKMVVNGCCLPKTLTHKTIRQDTPALNKELLGLCCTFLLPPFFIQCLCFSLCTCSRVKDVQVHLCSGCDRQVGVQSYALQGPELEPLHGMNGRGCRCPRLKVLYGEF